MAKIEFISNPSGEDRLGDVLVRALRCNDWDTFFAAIAFVKSSGVRHIIAELKEFSKRGSVQISVGVDCRGTTYEGLLELFNAVSPSGKIFVFHNENPSTFHPKVFVFKNDRNALLVVGSGNMTEGGFFTNYEAGVLFLLDMKIEEDTRLLKSVENVLVNWSTVDGINCVQLDLAFLEQLLGKGYLSKEGQTTTAFAEDEANPDVQKQFSKKLNPQDRLFVRQSVKSAPRYSGRFSGSAPKTKKVDKESSKETARQALHAGFVMTLQQTDVGTGQTTKGTSRRSPEIFIPLGARDSDPGFWGYPELFVHEEKKDDRTGVHMNIEGSVVLVNIMCWLLKKDMRLRSEALRSAGHIDDLLKIEIASSDFPYDYEVEIIPKGSPKYSYFRKLCVNKPKGNSKKYWGYY